MRRHHEAISELPVTVGEGRKQRSSSRYIGVSWCKARSSSRQRDVRVTDPQTYRLVYVMYSTD
jgi:hypothetical protein